ncbi:LysR family transcriptional regulator [Burkholderia plantarii]|uniref:Transcriptional regulator LysR family n=1 Tax=Burkholderia plantarii TaxID=41899 RepID=A0A0B6SDW7_BURPL|nr:LysR family transcriptional regulator [Burkholderia plantarii]AJK50411.1 transcriptional regulator LysR family [Burkholderia plantarii]
MNERVSLTELRALAAVAAHRSFRKAADEMELAPSTLSHLMRELEARLGMRLLNRTTRSVAPTEAGARLVAQLQPLLRGLDDALSDLSAARDEPGGRLRLTASETVSMLLVQHVIPAFLARHPRVEVDLVAQPEFVDIVAERYDAGFRLGDEVPRDMVAVRFGSPSRMLTVASPAYLKRHPAPKTPDDLARHRCIRSRTPAGRPYRWEFARHGQPHVLDVPGTLTLNRTELMIEAALRGLGIAFVPELLAMPYLRDRSLRAVLSDWCPAYVGLFLYYPGHRQVPAALRAFIEVLKELDVTRV